MFDILFKRSSVVLDCFTWKPSVFNIVPIAPASKYIPNWWRSLPNHCSKPGNHVSQVPETNMKTGCAGFIEYYKRGIVIPMWSDLIIEVTKDSWNYQYPRHNFEIVTHDHKESNFAFSHYHHLKIISPWRFKCKEDIHFHWSSPFWNHSSDPGFYDNFHVMHGVLEFKYQTTTNTNVFVTRRDQRFDIEANTPLVFMYPNTDKKIIVKNHCIDQNEFVKLFLTEDVFFTKSYYRVKKIKQ